MYYYRSNILYSGFELITMILILFLNQARAGASACLVSYNCFCP